MEASLAALDYPTANYSFPRRIGRYEMIYPISHGGMASVFAGRLTGLAGFQRLVAIKIIHPHLSSQLNFIEMFLDEARLAACIHHPNVGEVYEVGEENGLYYMVCELVLGQTLNEFVARACQKKVRISPAFYARVASLTALALQAAHDLKSPDGESLQLVHRDVSTRNILLSYDGFVKLIDFGVAYAADKVSHTDTGTLKGKVGYMSPEQVKGKPLDRRSDIFSLGVVLYVLTTGRMPFGGKSEVDRLYRIITYQFESPGRISPDVPAALENIILRAMAFDPAERYQSAAAMSAELEEFIRTSGVTVDTGLLSGTMHSLFEEEREHHLLKMRSIGRSATWKRPVVPSYDLTRMMPVRPQPETFTGRQTRTVGSLLARVTGLMDTPQKKTLVAGILAMVVAAIVFLLWPAPESDFSADMPVQVSDADNASIPSVPQADVPLTGSESVAGASASDSEVTVSFELEPPDALLKVDDIAVASGTKSLQLAADGGKHRISVSADGYVPMDRTITADTDWKLEISLSPLKMHTPVSESNQPMPQSHRNPVKRPNLATPQPAVRLATDRDESSESTPLNDKKDSVSAPSSLLQKSPYQ